jgi:BirA family biotin operon repressor/biotin-[acetyl-CoA-carboxylase] ligase
LDAKTIEWRIHTFEEVDSTQRVAKELAVGGAPEGIVVIAEAQSQGRGRAGRRWISPPGGLWLSAVLRPKLAPAEAQRVTLAVGVAAARAITRTTGLKVELKWPNDVLIGGRKVCGVLTESSVRSGLLEFLVIGVGINANVDPTKLPPDLHTSTTSISRELRREVPIEELTKAVLEELQNVYASLGGGSFASVLSDWKGLTSTIGSWVEVKTPDGVVEGLAEDVNLDGSLTLRLRNGSRTRIVAGDASLRRKDRLKGFRGEHQESPLKRMNDKDAERC